MLLLFNYFILIVVYYNICLIYAHMPKYKFTFYVIINECNDVLINFII